jgi:hydroxyacylglutathione hydrolase
MFFAQITAEGIAHQSYLIGSGNEAVVIDPRRDCDIYCETAEQYGMCITRIFETHRNEDYAIGSGELAARTGADIYHGAALPFRYGHPVKDGDRFGVGDLLLTVKETPGHTDESLSFVLAESQTPDMPLMVFTGDLLFAGDTGRTDLGGEGRGREMAGAMYDSIVEKILLLGDAVIVCPAHGAGSVCGGAIRDLPLTTLGYERKTNPRLALDRERFIAGKTGEHHYVPPYFRRMEQGNRDGWDPIHRLPDLTPVKPGDLNKYRAQAVQVVDIRSPSGFAAGHIPGSISIWRDGLPAFMGWFLDYEHQIVLVDDFNVDLDAVKRHFVRLGYDNLTGYLHGGFPAWFKAAGEMASFPALSVQEAARQIVGKSPFLLDVRDRKNRKMHGHIAGDQHVYAGELPHHLDEIPKNRPVFVYCDAGYKGSLAASVLTAHGYRDVSNVLGGFTAWENAGYPVDRSD